MILKRLLGKMGFEVTEAANGVEGLARLKEMQQPTVVMVDWNMPEMNGYDFLCYVRAHPNYRDVPLMMVTSETEIAQMTKALAAGANEYVMKPFTKEVIADKLALLGLMP